MSRITGRAQKLKVKGESTRSKWTTWIIDSVKSRGQV